MVRIAPNEVAIAGIHAYREIHKIGTQFIRSPWYQGQFPTQYSDDTCGIFGVRDPKKAIERRKLFQQAGTKTAVLQWEPVIVATVQQAVKKIKRDAQNGKANVMLRFRG